MYSRSERNFEQLISSTQSNSDLGPGRYDFEESLREANKRRGYAPFNSLTRRVSYFEETKSQNPAPGNYHLELATYLIKPNTANPACFGKSKAGRFSNDDSVSPGPASYNLQNSNQERSKSPHKALIPMLKSSFIPKVIKEDKEHEANIFCYRKFIPPSIPFGKFAAGYDETQEGDLMPRPTTRKPIKPEEIKGFAELGKQVDNKGTVFAKSKSAKGRIFSPQEGPGPGSYNVSKDIPVTIVKGQSTSSRASRSGLQKGIKKDRIMSLLSKDMGFGVLRYSDQVAAEAQKQNIPGPGSYDYKLTSSTPKKTVSFSKTSQQRDATTKSEGPGPGSYNVSDHRPFSSSKGRRAFNSTTPRFQKASSNPELAPGAYELDQISSLATQVQKKIESNPAQAFGSTVDRFIERERSIKKKITPAPCDYQSTLEKSNDILPGEEPPQPVSGFGTQADRFSKPVEEAPAPGNYEVALSYRLVTEKGLWWLNRGLIPSGTDRQVFKVSEKHLPGPGQYNPKLKLESKPINVDIYKHCTIEERFQSKPTHIPGPGYYGADVQYANSLLRKTHNVTLDPPKSSYV